MYVCWGFYLNVISESDRYEFKLRNSSGDVGRNCVPISHHIAVYEDVPEVKLHFRINIKCNFRTNIITLMLELSILLSII